MKKYSLLLAILFPIAAVAQNNLKIRGKVSVSTFPKMAYLMHNNKIQDSALVKNGSFILSLKVAEPEQALLFIRHKETYKVEAKYLPDALRFWIEKGNINIISADSVKNAQISGSAINKDAKELDDSIKVDKLEYARLFVPIYNKMATNPNVTNEPWAKAKMDSIAVIQKRIGAAQSNFMKTHLSSYYAFAMFCAYIKGTPGFTAAQVREKIARFSPELAKTQIAKDLETYIVTLDALKVGNHIPEISYEDINGKPFTLSSLKGKYILLDFWASWCKPCRAENPNLRKAYQALKDKGLEIVSISIDVDGVAWKKAVEQDGLPWIQISDLKSKGGIGDQFGIYAIPQNFLVDPSGVIIGTNLRGEGVDKALAQLMKVE